MKKSILFLFLAGSIALLISCGDKNPPATNDKGPKPTLVTTTQIKNQSLEITEQAVGSLEGLVDPTVAAEVAARVIKVHVNPGQSVKQGQAIATLDATDLGLQQHEAQAEVARIEVLLENQDKIVARSRSLVQKNFISQNMADNDIAQQNVLKQQLEAAKTRVGSIQHTRGKTTVFAPVSGVIEKKLVDTGEFVRVGDPLVQIISQQRLRAHLPFPEHIAAQLQPGLSVRLSTPTADNIVETRIHELKPMISSDNRSVDVIADVINAPGWQPGASVNGTVILGQRPSAMMVPEQCVVLRPAGEVVYVVRNNIAYQAVVKTGLRQQGWVELTHGVDIHDTIVVDGAGFLTDRTPIKISQPPAQPLQKPHAP